MLACMLISGLALAARRAVQLASYTKGFVRMFRNREPCFALQLPIEDLCSLSSRSLQSPFTATVPASTEDVLLKGFQMLDMENDRIETAQQVTFFFASSEQQLTVAWCAKCLVLNLCQFVLQFFAWFAKLQANMDQDENIKYRCGNVKIIFFYPTPRLCCHTECYGNILV